MNMKLIKKSVAIACIAMPFTASAEDIDLFVSPAVSAADAPNVLIILDNTANWNTAFPNEKAALVDTFNNLPLNKFNLGIMMYGATDVGYVRAAVRNMDATNRPLYSALVNGLDDKDDKASARTLARTMSEAYRYLKGLQSTEPGVTTSKNDLRDYSGNTAGNAATDAIHALPGNALSSSSDSTYTSPINPSSCNSNNYVIYIGNTLPSGNVTKDNNSRNAMAGSELAAAGGNTTQIPLTYTAHQGNYADEWARFMKQDLGVTVYTVDVDPTPMPGGHGNGMGNSALIESMATVSDGKYFRVDSSVGGGSEISAALNSIFSEIQSVNSVFASVSLPVSVNTQGTYLNQVYVGMFRPDEDSLPRWAGNLKQYRLAQVGTDLKLVDAYEPTSSTDSYNQAINTSTGFIAECARSYWTPTTANNYWAFKGFDQTCLAIANSADSDYPDGNMVEKGAQGYMLRTGSSRNMLTCDPAFATCASTSALTNFDDGNALITAADLGAVDAAERTQLINWTRGIDVDDEDGDGVRAELRPSMHGDIVHSRPVAINFGTQASPEVVVFYGGNDGALRAINGNRSAAITSTSAGEELWSFMPPEFYGGLKRLRTNDGTTDGPYITYPGIVKSFHEGKEYGMDGAITAYWKDGNSDGDLKDPFDEAIIYATMRRGGRALYAFDVSRPATPTLKWKVGCPNNFTAPGVVDDTGCSTGFSGIGQTWSSPTTIYSSGYGSGASPMLIMGGGYDTCDDTDSGTSNHSCGVNPKGSQIYVVDALTGSLLTTLNTNRSVVGAVTVLTDASGLATYAYAADMGGDVYRITIGSAAPGSWFITRLADLGCSTIASCNARRKFMYAPDVVTDGVSNFLTLGSGDREKPLAYYAATQTVTNYFYMIEDRPGDASWLTSESSNCGTSRMCMNSLVSITGAADPSESDLTSKKGWALQMASQEQVVTSSITVFDTVTFSSHAPAAITPGVCTSLGNTKVYNISFRNATSMNGTGSRSEDLSGDGLPPSPVAGMVTLDDGSTVPFIIGADAGSPLEAKLPAPPSSGSQPTSRVFWNVEQ